MTTERIATALARIESILTRRPEAAMHADEPAAARWEGGTRVLARHPNGDSVATDLPPELGGSAAGVTPGWLWRAALSSCLTTRIVMAAAVAGIDLSGVEVVARTAARICVGSLA